MKPAGLIASRDNPRFKSWLKIAGQVKERRKTGLTLLDGVHLLQALAQSGGRPEPLFVRSGCEQDAEIAETLRLFAETEVVLLAPNLFDLLSPSDHPVGISALYRLPDLPSSPNEGAAILLEKIQDPGNLGTILRSALAAGVCNVFLSAGCTEAWSPKALRAGMGAQFALQIFEQVDLGQRLPDFGSSFALMPDADQSLYDCDLRGDVAFVLGNEGAGLDPDIAACATHQVRIPMPGSAESLNVGAAAAVCLFERVRQIRLGS